MTRPRKHIEKEKKITNKYGFKQRTRKQFAQITYFTGIPSIYEKIIK